MTDNNKRALFGMTLNELKALCSELNMPGFTAKQMADWLYQKRVFSIDEMTNLSRKNREILAESCILGRSPATDVQISQDGTKKYLYETSGSRHVESVYIPDSERATLCISSQVGCKRQCEFCMTGRQGLQGNLSCNEILNQIFSLPEFDSLTNVVYMGMGEPLDNPNEVMKSLEVLTAPWGLAWSPKRITLSTIGVLPSLKRFLEESQVHLAVSMHNPLSEERQKIMPVEKKYPIKDVLALAKAYDFSKQRRISFEYILFKGENDSLRHADELVRLVNGVKCRINLIRFHSIPNSELTGSDEKTIIAFQNRLKAKGITCTLRASRGMDILAACGMLSTRKQEEQAP